MRSHRLRRLAAACRLSVLLLITIVIAPRGADAAAIAGRVLDPDGRAVPNARVVVSTSLGTAAETATDAQGAFAVDALPAGRFDVSVVADGFQADPLPLTLAARDRRDVDIRLRLSAVAESIVVSAAQVDTPLSRAADRVTVITSADLAARQIETVSDALRLVPGLAVMRSGGRGAITSIFPRGGESNYTLVLVDGMRLNDFGGGYDFAHLSVADIDRIEIVRGPQSALFGSDAIGAVVQIVTRRDGRPRANGLLEGGSQGTMRATAGASGSSGAWSWGGGAEKTASDGFTGIAPADGERVSNDDYHLTHASGTLGYQRPGGLDVTVTGRADRDERGLPGPYGSDPTGVFPGVDRTSREVDTTRQVGARVSHPWTSRMRQRLELNYTDIGTDYAGPYGASTTGTRRVEGRVQEDAAFNTSFAASAGVDFFRERGTSTYIVAGAGTPIPIQRTTVGTFGELRYVARERLFVTAGVRAEHLARDAVPANADPYSPRPAFAAEAITSVNPKVAVSYLVAGTDATASTRIHASAGTGIRAPDAFEIAFTDNPNLKPERSRSADAGIEQQFAGGAYVVGATAFFNRYDDLIVAIGRALANASQYRTDNISNARARGLELSGDARLGAGFTLHANYTFLDTAVLSADGLAAVAPPPFKVGDALIRRPRHQGSVDLTYGRGRVTAFGELTSRSQVLDVEPNYGASGGLFFTPGYTVANAGANLRVTGQLAVYARVLNLADRAYEETLGYPALRRSAIVGVRVAAGR